MKSPKVGIYWLVKGRLIFDSTPLQDAEPYGDCKNHPRGHIDRWGQMQRAGIVPPDIEYEVYPRGRVIFDAKTEKFSLLADRCILKKRNLVKKIMAELQLPAAMTECDPDLHGNYVCRERQVEVQTECTVAELVASYDELARKAIRRIYELFNWNNSREEMIRGWQERLLNHRL